MRRVPGHTPGVVREFVPRAYGNDKDQSPVRLWIRTPTEREKREILSRGDTVRMAVDSAGNPVPGKVEVDLASSMATQQRVVEAFVERVENYEAAGGVPITNGAELATNGETEIVAEAYVEILHGMRLSDKEKKTSHASSASATAVTSASPGTAESAKPAASPPRATVSIPTRTPASNTSRRTA